MFRIETDGVLWMNEIPVIVMIFRNSWSSEWSHLPSYIFRLIDFNCKFMMIWIFDLIITQSITLQMWWVDVLVKSVLYKYRKETNMTLIRESTFSKRVLEIDVNFIEKYIHCSLQGGPSGGPACPPVVSI